MIVLLLPSENLYSIPYFSLLSKVTVLTSVSYRDLDGRSPRVAPQATHAIETGGFKHVHDLHDQLVSTTRFGV